MSDNSSDKTDAGGGAFQAAKDAVASAAEQVRASAPCAYDASAKAARYVGEATADHPLPVLLVTAALAFLAGYASHTRREDDRWGWRNQAGDWQKRGYEVSERARAARRPFRKRPQTRVNTLPKMSVNTRSQERSLAGQSFALGVLTFQTRVTSDRPRRPAIRRNQLAGLRPLVRGAAVWLQPAQLRYEGKRKPMAAYRFGGLEGTLLRPGESGLMSMIG